MSLEQVIFIGSSCGGERYILEMAPKLNLEKSCLIVCSHICNKDIYESLKQTCQNIRYVVEGENFLEGAIYVFDYEAGLADTINPAMESLSNAYKEKMVAVILSGCGSDGASGSKVVKENGGKIFVQKIPKEYCSWIFGPPYCSEMPNSTRRACGSVDFFGTAEDITDQLNLIVGNPKAFSSTKTQPLEIGYSELSLECMSTLFS